MRCVPLLLAVLLLPTGSPSAQPLVAVERSDVDAFLAELSRAYAEEDIDAILATMSESLKKGGKHQLRRTFADRNFFELTHDVISFRSRADGAAEVEVLWVLRSRPRDEPNDVRERGLSRYLIRRTLTGLVMDENVELPQPKLTFGEEWTAESWTGVVAIHPEPKRAFRSAAGRVEVDLTGVLRNGTAIAMSSMSFALDPYASDMRVSTDGGADLPIERDVGELDIWRVELPAEVPPKGTATVRFRYALDVVGVASALAVTPEGSQLFTAAAWHPVFVADGSVVPASHDLTIEVPEGQRAVAPGALAGTSRTETGRVRYRWVSRLPGEDLAVVAGPFTVRSEELTPGLTLDVYQLDPSQDLEQRLADFRTFARFATDVLGEPPVDRLSLVELVDGRRRAAPGFFATSDLPGSVRNPWALPPAQDFFFFSHHVAHLWLVEPVGFESEQARTLAEALCDHLAGEWAAVHVHEEVASTHRERILGRVQLQPEKDIPVVGTIPEHLDDATHRLEKARIVFDQYRVFAGDARWKTALRSLAQSHRGTEVSVQDVLDALTQDDPLLERFIATWMLGSGFSNPLVADVTVTEHEAGSSEERRGHVSLTLTNDGLGPVRVPVRVRAPHVERVFAVDLGEGDTTLLDVGELPLPVLEVRLDPDRLLWQRTSNDDRWPEPPPVRPELAAPERADPDELQALIDRMEKR